MDTTAVDEKKEVDFKKVSIDYLVNNNNLHNFSAKIKCIPKEIAYSEFGPVLCEGVLRSGEKSIPFQSYNMNGFTIGPINLALASSETGKESEVRGLYRSNSGFNVTEATFGNINVSRMYENSHSSRLTEYGELVGISRGITSWEGEVNGILDMGGDKYIPFVGYHSVDDVRVPVSLITSSETDRSIKISGQYIFDYGGYQLFQILRIESSGLDCLDSKPGSKTTPKAHETLELNNESGWKSGSTEESIKESKPAKVKSVIGSKLVKTMFGDVINAMNRGEYLTGPAADIADMLRR